MGQLFGRLIQRAVRTSASITALAMQADLGMAEAEPHVETPSAGQDSSSDAAGTNPPATASRQPTVAVVERRAPEISPVHVTAAEPATPPTTRLERAISASNNMPAPEKEPEQPSGRPRQSFVEESSTPSIRAEQSAVDVPSPRLTLPPARLTAPTVAAKPDVAASGEPSLPESSPSSPSSPRTAATATTQPLHRPDVDDASAAAAPPPARPATTAPEAAGPSVSAAAAAELPDITITIGRIELSAPPPIQQLVAPPTAPPVHLTLAEYMTRSERA